MKYCCGLLIKEKENDSNHHFSQILFLKPDLKNYFVCNTNKFKFDNRLHISQVSIANLLNLNFICKVIIIITMLK